MDLFCAGMIKFLIDNDMFDGDQMTVTGKTHKQNLEDMNHPGLTPGQEIIRPLSDPIKKTGHLQIMYGNLCPGGGVAKITGKEGETFTVRWMDSLIWRWRGFVPCPFRWSHFFASAVLTL
jgi:dihydroxyacid dehydratase/phosphogluconate dehydratase